MNRIDELFTQYLIYGTRQRQFGLRSEGWKVGRRQIARIMHILGLEPADETAVKTGFMLRNIREQHVLLP